MYDNSLPSHEKCISQNAGELIVYILNIKNGPSDYQI